MEDDISEQDQVADDFWVSASGFVFEQAGIFSPVIFDFYPAPMISNRLQPLFGGLFVKGLRAEIMAAFPLPAFLFRAELSPHQNYRPCVREIHIQWIYRFDHDLTLDIASVGFFR